MVSKLSKMSVQLTTSAQSKKPAIRPVSAFPRLATRIRGRPECAELAWTSLWTSFESVHAGEQLELIDLVDIVAHDVLCSPHRGRTMGESTGGCLETREGHVISMALRQCTRRASVPDSHRWIGRGVG